MMQGKMQILVEISCRNAKAATAQAKLFIYN
jgi:hypothetical protein